MSAPHNAACTSTAWDGRRKCMAVCTLPVGHNGAHDDGDAVWTVDVPAPRAGTLRARVFAAVAEEPWSTTPDIVAELLDVKQDEVSAALGRLYQQGKLERRRLLGGKRAVTYAYRVREGA